MGVSNHFTLFFENSVLWKHFYVLTLTGHSSNAYSLLSTYKLSYSLCLSSIVSGKGLQINNKIDPKNVCGHTNLMPD